jgi:hypothetical protein
MVRGGGVPFFAVNLKVQRGKAGEQGEYTRDRA